MDAATVAGVLAAGLGFAAIIAALVKLAGRRRVRLSWPATILLALAGTVAGSAVGSLLAVNGVDRRVVAGGVAVAVTFAGAVLAARLRPATVATTVADLIAGGESQWVEFKETARHNVRSGSKDAAVEHAIAKTVAGFHNSDGGILLIGVADDGTPTGLARDLAYVRRDSRDAFELWLRNYLGAALGAALVLGCDFTFADVDGQTMAVLTVPPGRNPAYLTYRDRAHFYVRSGNSTVSLSIPDTVAYLGRGKRLPAARHPRPVLH